MRKSQDPSFEPRLLDTGIIGEKEVEPGGVPTVFTDPDSLDPLPSRGLQGF